MNKASNYRAIWQAANGPIPAGHVIHHVNCDRTDNRLENLVLMSARAHLQLHAEYEIRAELAAAGIVEPGIEYWASFGSRSIDGSKLRVYRQRAGVSPLELSAALRLDGTSYLMNMEKRLLTAVEFTTAVAAVEKVVAGRVVTPADTAIEGAA